MVLTSHDVLGNTGLKTGFGFEEFAAPYFVFRDAGVPADPRLTERWATTPDPKSDLPASQTPAQIRFK
jgi:putative intracellular protease/amidase